MNENNVPIVKKVTWLDKAFMLFLILRPILIYYQSPISSLNLATFLLFPLLLLLIVLKRKITLPPAAFIWYFVVVLANLIITKTVSEGVLPYCRSILWALTTLCFAHFCFDTKTYFRLLRNFLFISVVLMVIQFVLSQFAGIRIRFRIDSLLRGTSYLTNRLTTLRPCGFYMEPAHFAQNAILYLIYELFGTEKELPEVPKWNNIIPITIGILLSGSGQGYVYLVVVFGLWLMQALVSKHGKHKLTVFFSFACVALFAVVFILSTSYGQFALSRIMATDEYGFGGSALAGRTYKADILNTLSGSQKWYGIGAYSKEDYTEAYMTSYISVGYTMGYIGWIYFAALAVFTCIKSKGFVRYSIILFVLLFFLASITNIATLVCFLIPLLYSGCVSNVNHFRKKQFY